MAVWKMWHNGLPTEDNFQKVNVSLASKCHCCLQPVSESLAHVVLDSDIAVFLWGDLNTTVRIMGKNSVQQLMIAWLVFSESTSCFLFLKKVICTVAHYMIWSHRIRYFMVNLL